MTNTPPPATAPAATPATLDSRYIDLQDPYFKNSLWSNDAADLELDAYFDAQKPNLGMDFGIAGLKPVIKHLQDETFLLVDGEGSSFYVWQPDDGNLWRILEQGLDAKTAALRVMNGIIEEGVVHMFCPPATEGGA